MVKKCRFLKIFLTFFLLLFALSAPFSIGVVHAEDGEEEEKCKLKFISNYPTSWNKEEETIEMETDLEHNFVFPECPFEGKDCNRFLYWYPVDNDYASFGYSGEKGYVNEDTVFRAVWGTTALVTYHSDFPEELGLEDKTETTLDGWIRTSFDYDGSSQGYYISEWISTDGDKYACNEYYKLTKDIELRPVWKKKDFIICNYDLNHNYNETSMVYRNDDGYFYIPSDNGSYLLQNQWKYIDKWEDDKGNVYKCGVKYDISPGTILNPVWEDQHNAIITLHLVYPECYGLEERKEVFNNRLYGSSLQILYNPDLPDGRKLIGYTDEDGDFYNIDYPFYCNKDTDLYAVWDFSNYYTIRFHSNYPKDWNLDDEVVERKTDAYGQCSPIYYNSGNGNAVRFSNQGKYVVHAWMDEQGDRIDESTVFHGDTDVYPIWEKSWTITYDSNYPKEIDNVWNQKEIKQSYREGYESCDYPKFFEDYYYITEDCNYAFVGWETPSGKLIKVNSTFYVNGDLTLKAVWEKRDTYNVTYHSNYPSMLGIPNVEKTIQVSSDERLSSYIYQFDFYGGYSPCGLYTKNSEGKMIELVSDFPTSDIRFFLMEKTDLL